MNNAFGSSRCTCTIRALRFQGYHREGFVMAPVNAENIPEGSLDRLHSVASEDGRWFLSLCNVLVKSHLPVRSAVLAAGEITLSLDRPGKAPLVLLVLAKKTGVNGWKETRNFIVAYRGERDLDDVEERLASHFRHILGKVEHRMPAALSGSASVGAKDADPMDMLTGAYPFITIERSRSIGDDCVEVLLRTISKCNQDCAFCSGSQDLNPSSEAVFACLSAISRTLPGAMVSVTGGEPTLKPRFMDEVDRALSLPGIQQVQVQTNAINFARRLDPARWAPEGKLTFFISLHAVDERLYDACTASRGLFSRATQGMKRVLAAGHPVIINTVVTSVNVAHVPSMPAALAEMFTGSNRPTWHLSALMCPEFQPRAEDSLVEYSVLIPALNKAVERARTLNVPVQSLLSSTHASPPACVLPEAERGGLRWMSESSGHAATDKVSSDWVKAKTCTGCSEKNRCLGVPASYARKFGFGELVPVG